MDNTYNLSGAFKPTTKRLAAGRKPAEEKPAVPAAEAAPAAPRPAGGIPDWMAGVTVGRSGEGS